MGSYADDKAVVIDSSESIPIRELGPITCRINEESNNMFQCEIEEWDQMIFGNISHTVFADLVMTGVNVKTALDNENGKAVAKIHVPEKSSMYYGYICLKDKETGKRVLVIDRTSRLEEDMVIKMEQEGISPKSYLDKLKEKYNILSSEIKEGESE